ncbi:sensor histidine kinase [Mucilaginibacter calamicampi]|uniref:histidine kinase n=1 Tax=Mucilaginibacter calamicampi TaxID=1302352 RepID=A0ABW2YRX3_9SPHI
MTGIVAISLENEMDLILAYKKSIKTGELLGLSISTQTSFATAVSEVCREVIDKTFDGHAVIGVIAEGDRFFLAADITFKEDDNLKKVKEGFEYARKLVPTFDVETNDKEVKVTLKIAIPRTAKVTRAKVSSVKRHFEEAEPISAYEEIKQRNDELFKLNEQQEIALLAAKYLNEQKDEFLSVASHELKTPLTILRSFAQLAIKTEGGNNQQLQVYLKKIEAQSTKMNTLIQQLLDISKIEVGRAEYQMEEVGLNEFLTNCIELMSLVLPSNQISIAFDNNVNVALDRLRIEQVLNNIIGNAAKYSTSGSAIALKTRIDGNKVSVIIEDQGIGMSDETLNQVFNKFYRSEQVIKKYNGLGMGLYIASRIIADHKGEITVLSAEGKGSTFCFTLPVVAN